VRQAVEKFEQAIREDSLFARAHAGLALSLQLLPYFESVSVASVRNRAIAAAERALQLDTTLAEAHTALAMVHQHAYEWPAAEAAFQRALRLDPDEPDTHLQYGRFLFYTGRLAPAQAEFERARALDPFSALASGWVGHLLQVNGRTREGLLEVQRALEIDSVNPPIVFFTATALADAGRRPEAVALLRRLWSVAPQWRTPSAVMLARLGDRSRADQLIREIESASPRPPLFHTALAFLHIAVRDTARGLTELDRATDAGENWPTYYSMSERLFDDVRASPRFAAALRRVGLDARAFGPDGGGGR
jgi:Tfp pilus assembly protein PilF